MKRLSILAIFGALLAFAPARSDAGAAVSFDFFYNELAPYGNWIDVDGYGYCFQPTVSTGWRPYYDGDWVYTDDGWCWNSNESWGWATYHYGRWANVGSFGWCWVPGYEWAPAWVSWRTGPNYCGWAPLPPECGWNGSRISFGVSFGFDIGPSYYNFCSPRYFGYGNVGRYCAPWRNNVNIIEQTTNITNITNVVNNNTTVINSGGPNYDFIRRNSDRPVRRAKIERVTEASGLRRNGRIENSLKGDKLLVASPKIAKNNNAKPKKVAAKASNKNVERGWSDITDRNRAKKLRETMKEEAQVAKSRTGGGKKTASANKSDNRNSAQNGPRTAQKGRDGSGSILKPFSANSGKRAASNDRSQSASERQRELAKQQRDRAASQKASGNSQQRQSAQSQRKQEADRAARQQQLARQQRQSQAGQAGRRQSTAAQDQRQKAQQNRAAIVQRQSQLDAIRRQQQQRQQQSRSQQLPQQAIQMRQRAQAEAARRQQAQRQQVQRQQVQRQPQEQRQSSSQRPPQISAQRGPAQIQRAPQQRMQRPSQIQRQPQRQSNSNRNSGNDKRQKKS